MPVRNKYTSFQLPVIILQKQIFAQSHTARMSHFKTSLTACTLQMSTVVTSAALCLLTYIPPPMQAAPTKATYTRFSLPSPAGPVDMWALGSRVGNLALFNPEIDPREI